MAQSFGSDIRKQAAQAYEQLLEEFHRNAAWGCIEAEYERGRERRDWTNHQQFFDVLELEKGLKSRLAKRGMDLRGLQGQVSAGVLGNIAKSLGASAEQLEGGLGKRPYLMKPFWIDCPKVAAKYQLDRMGFQPCNQNRVDEAVELIGDVDHNLWDSAESCFNWARDQERQNSEFSALEYFVAAAWLDFRKQLPGFGWMLTRRAVEANQAKFRSDFFRLRSLRQACRKAVRKVAKTADIESVGRDVINDTFLYEFRELIRPILDVESLADVKVLVEDPIAGYGLEFAKLWTEPPGVLVMISPRTRDVALQLLRRSANTAMKK